MRYEVEVGGRTRTVGVTRVGGRLAVAVNGHTWLLDAARIDEDTLSVIVAAVPPHDDMGDTADPQGPPYVRGSGDVVREPDPTSARRPDLALARRPDLALERRPDLALERRPDLALERRPDLALERRPDLALERRPDLTLERRPDLIRSGNVRSPDRMMAGGRSYDVTIVPDAGGQLSVLVGATPCTVMLNGGRRRRHSDDSGAGDGPDRVTAPMPGKVVRVLVGAGDAVRARQPLAVVEAMKMENELRAGRDGIVAAIHVKEGASVDAGAMLFEIR